MKSKLRNKIIALAIAGLMLVNVTAFAEAPLTSDVAVEDVAVEDVGAETILPNENQMLNIIDDDFTKFDGLDDAAIRTKLTDGGYTIIESADTITFSATAEKGLKMLRNGTSSDVSINRPLAQDGSTLTGIADDKTLMPGYNMKTGGKYYVDYTFSYDQTAAYINASGNWKNIFFRTNINKSKPKEINTYLGTIVTLTNATDDIHVQYLVDSGAGNADGNSPQCVVNAFINGKQVVTNGENKYTSGGKNYYTSFLTNIGITLQKSNAVNGGSVYLKNMKVSKVVDETSDAFEKEALAVAPIVGAAHDSVTDSIVLPAGMTGGSVVWSSSDASVIAADGTVTRPTDADKKVTLTATISKNESTLKSIRTFDFVVKKTTALAPEMANVTYSTLSSETATFPMEITKNLKKPLPSTFDTAGTITWASSNTAVIANDGTVTRPKRTEKDENVAMTATFSNGGITDTKVFNFFVKRVSGELIIDDDVDALTDADILKDNTELAKIESDLILPLLGELAGSTIVWSADVIEDCPINLEIGKVTQPIYGDDVPVNLTATFTKGDETRTKTFAVTVLVNSAPVDNIALRKPATASTTHASPGYTVDKAFDANEGTRWASATGAVAGNCWLKVDLGKEEKVNVVRIYEFAGRMTNFNVEYSSNGNDWTVAANKTAASSNVDQFHELKFEPVTGRYFRINVITLSSDPSIYEFELYDTTTRKYSVKAKANDELLGTTEMTNGPGFKIGEKVTLTAQAKDIANFTEWTLPTSLTLIDGTSKTDATISFNMPKENIKLQANFKAKKVPEIDKTKATYDLYEKSLNHKDVVVNLKVNEFSLEEIKNGKNVLVKDTDYTIAGDVITIKNEYLKKFKEKQVIVFKMNAGENPTLNIDVVNTDPNILIMKDFAELELPAYNLIDGSTIVATGVNGTDFTVTSESSLIRITRETINGVLVNMIHYTRPQTSQIVTMTVSGNLGGISTPYSYKYAIKGTGGGSSGGGGGGSTGGGSNNNNSHKNPGSGTISFNDGMNTPENPDVIPPKDDIFSDLGDAEWAKIYIEALAKNQIVSGDEDGKFNPNNQITREEFVKMLVGSMDIEPINSASLPFDDVKTDDWAYAYIAAAYEKGLINGVDENNFGMGNFISRQDIAVILNRAIKDINPNKVVEDTTFSDDNNAEEYAKESIKNIVGYGIMGGYPDGTFMPKNTITRAETAKVLSKIIDLKGAK